MKIIVSKLLDKRMRKTAGWWDTIKNVGNQVADTYDKARMGWEIGKIDPKPRWQQKLDAATTPPEQYTDSQGNVKYVSVNPETGEQKPANPHYKPELAKGMGNRAYQSNYGNIFSTRNKLRMRGKQLTQKGEKSFTDKDQTIAKRIQEALEKEEQGNESLIQQLEKEGFIVNVQAPTQPVNNQNPQQGQPVANQPGPQAVNAQPVQQGMPAGNQMATPTGQITGVFSN